MIARSPAVSDTGRPRYLGHDRRPPEGYVPCFGPSLTAVGGNRIARIPHRTPVPDDRIRACEARDWLGRESASRERSRGPAASPSP